MSEVNQPLQRQFRSISKQFMDMTNGLSHQGFDATGKLLRFSGSRLEVGGLRASIGARCLVEGAGSGLIAEVIGFEGERLILACEDTAVAVSLGASVRLIGSNDQVAVGDDLLGRVIDGAGVPLDGGPLNLEERVPLRGGRINPMNRSPISEPIDVGVRSINALLSIGRGQRVGLFAGSGVGKTTLLGMITRFTDADVVVVSLVGERGREVKEFVEDSLGPEGLKRAVVVATPADTSPLMRVAGCWRATAIAEYYRDQGANVLLLMDSVTRFAQAQREIALSAGEPPVAKGYTPSVFSLIPSLIERAGIVGKGSITAIYTVLVEGDDLQDPVADVARASLDGHIVLSRRMADAGIYPAIDLEKSVSRSMINIAGDQHHRDACLVKDVYSTYEENRDLISIGAYKHGSDPKIDTAILAAERVRAFIAQPLDEKETFAASIAALGNLADELQFSSSSHENSSPSVASH